MSWEELYPVVREQAYYAVLRYDPRRKDKIQELVCQSYEKFTRDEAAGKEVKKQDYKCFVTQRAKEVDQRSFCKKGYGGTSTIDVLSFYRRRPDIETEVVEFDEWMTSKSWRKDAIEEQMSFNVDFKNWQKTLTTQEHTILTHLIQGYRAKDIAEILHLTYQTIRQIIKHLKEMFLEYFRLEEFAYP
ncbi:MAG: LuxR C-terminal-related transcriptional regulator [Ignavibacteriaceae bacterium]|nr:LuxR C-terminal-related transcriptional regulator [Ignavibacteriaceae bacterium]